MSFKKNIKDIISRCTVEQSIFTCLQLLLEDVIQKLYRRVHHYYSKVSNLSTAIASRCNIEAVQHCTSLLQQSIFTCLLLSPADAIQKLYRRVHHYYSKVSNLSTAIASRCNIEAVQYSTSLVQQSIFTCLQLLPADVIQKLYSRVLHYYSKVSLPLYSYCQQM